MAAARLPRAARHAAAVRSVHGAAGASRIFVPPAAVMQTQRITLLHHTAAPPFTAHARQRYRRCSTAASASGGPAGAVPWLAGLQAWPAKSMPAVGSGSGNGSNGVEKLSSQQQQQQQQVVALDPAGVSSLPPVDAIMVLAGGLLRDGGLPLWVARRLDVAHGLHVLQQHRPPVVCLGGCGSNNTTWFRRRGVDCRCCPRMCCHLVLHLHRPPPAHSPSAHASLSKRHGAAICTCVLAAAGGGTPHKPDVLMPSGHVLHESTACSRYLLDQGMSPHAILKGMQLNLLRSFL